MRSIASMISARGGATLRSVIKKSARRLLRAAFLTGDANVAGHDFSLAAEVAGGTLLHVHQLAQTSLPFS
jgi:hypothetical protein